jgi:hypothetical protein
MPFSKNWIETEPDGGIVTVSQLDNWIRDTKIAIRERLEDYLFEPGSFASGPIITVGSPSKPLRSDTYLDWDPTTGAAIRTTIPGFIASMAIAAVDEPVAGHARMILGSNGTNQHAWPLIPTEAAANFPASGSTTFQGLIAVDNTNNRLVVFAQNLRYYINFTGTF